MAELGSLTKLGASNSFVYINGHKLGNCDIMPVIKHCVTQWLSWDPKPMIQVNIGFLGKLN